jgi:hypothetical protein
VVAIQNVSKLSIQPEISSVFLFSSPFGGLGVSRMSKVPYTSLCLSATYVMLTPTLNIDFVLMVSKSTRPLNLLDIKVIRSAVPRNIVSRSLFIYFCYSYMFRPLLAILFLFPKSARGFEPISYRGALLSTLLHATVYVFLHNLLNVLIQIENRMLLQKKYMYTWQILPL